METIEQINWELEKERFEQVAYPLALRAAKRAVRRWHSRKKDDAIQEFLAKTWDSWKRLLERGRDPEPMLWPLLYWAKQWVYQDRRLSGRPRNIDIQDFRAKMTQHLMDGRGRLRPHDRAARINGFFDWSGVARTDDPAALVAAMDALGVTLEDLSE
jgi:hypothetical protein